MGVKDGELIRSEGWPLGINNVKAETAVPDGALRGAKNVDIDDDGKLRLRAGYTLVDAIDARGIWSDPVLDFGLYARGNELCALDEDETVTVLDSSLDYTDLACCALLEQAVWTDGARIGRVLADKSLRPMGCEQPIGNPAVAAYASGGMAAGIYQVAITYTDSDGQESGASQAIEVELTAGQGLQLTRIPVPTDASTTWVHLFATDANGEELYWRKAVPAGTTSWILGVGDKGRRLETQFCSPMPAGQFLAHQNGRLFVAAGQNQYYSEPLRYGLTKLHENYVRYGGRINMMLPVGEAGAGSGQFVAAGKRTYWMSGADPRSWQRVIAYPHDAVAGTGVLVPGNLLGIEGVTTNVAFWLATNGVFCIGLPGGLVQPFTEGKYLADHATRGATLLRELNGIRQMLVTTDEGEVNNAKFGDTLVSTIHRNGIQVS